MTSWYQQTHGHYIVPLAQRLLEARHELERQRELRRWQTGRLMEALRWGKLAIARQAQMIFDLREASYQEAVRTKRAEHALGEIEAKARWYAGNAARDPLEVDHALCVEILDVAERALDLVRLRRIEVEQ